MKQFIEKLKCEHNTGVQYISVKDNGTTFVKFYDGSNFVTGTVDFITDLINAVKDSETQYCDGFCNSCSTIRK